MTKRMSLVGISLVAALVALCGAPVAQASETDPVPLTAQHWDDAYQRWRDIATNPYAAAKRAGYVYEQAVVTLTYNETDRTFVATLVATGLKPNFAYEVKLNGKPPKPAPGCPWGWDDGDKWANEQLGYAGRWWVNKVKLTPEGWVWVDGWNSTDSEYEYWRAEEFADDTHYYVFEGYLLFDYFVTGSDGTATVEFSLDSSLHVLWKTSQRAPSANDTEPTSHTVVAPADSDWYDVDYPDATEEIYGEWEPGRALPGDVVLPQGEYNVRIFLTEESFHETAPDSGSWATVMACDDVLFTVQHAPMPVKYWAVICGVADYPGTANDLNYTDDDALDLKTALEQYAEWRGVGKIQLLLDSAASKSGIQNAIALMGERANDVTDDHDVCLFFFSGHGTWVADGSGEEADGYDEAICPWDSVITDDELGGWLASSLPADADVVAMFDTCFSGGMAKGAKGLTVKSLRNPRVPRKAKVKRPFGRGLARRLGARGAPGTGGAKDIGGTNSVVLMACEEGGSSYEWGKLENGLFSYYVVEGLNGKADEVKTGNRDGFISAEEDFAYAKPRTERAARRLRVTQVPQLQDGNPYTEAILLQLGGEQPPNGSPSISGTITLNTPDGSPWEGVEVRLYKVLKTRSVLAATTLTDATGYYGFSDLLKKTYRVEPSSQGHTFSPESYTVTLTKSNPSADCDFVMDPLSAQSARSTRAAGQSKGPRMTDF